MKAFQKNGAGIFVITLGVLEAGCQSDPSRIGVTNRTQPGPALGQAIGSVAGGVGGNVVGGVVGLGEGIVTAGSQSFKNERHIIRRWRKEKTSDGRIIDVPEDVLVDELGRPLSH